MLIVAIDIREIVTEKGASRLLNDIEEIILPAGIGSEWDANKQQEQEYAMHPWKNLTPLNV